ncbi:MAG: hypothetical protein KDI07_00290 [Anaerolineae bacterium]|nr:hypothetical protein [Anaerolineae bacterium]MCB9130464.1 hypothetical protein [Anaerolineales bacterium]MCB0229405.1 hypothetical protein [Anaerolineae bacterium]MCB0235503.1 hypothetical protein [Anaerolineae bacterium]MCB0238006.1 hypothetical protein [Anaerolineae bacterium]
MAGSKKHHTLEYDWDPQKTVIVRNKSAHNILLDLPTGYFRLDAGRSFGMTRDIADLPQVKDLVTAGEVEITSK